jgi:hypothetical protein
MTTKITKTPKVTKDLTDAEIEAIVADAIAAEAAHASAEAQPPSSAIVWWRAQMRARQEAARLAEKPITIVHALSIAAGIGLMLSVVGYAVAGVKGSFAWFSGMAQSLTATAVAVPLEPSRWVSIALTATLVSVLVATVAAYFIFADD